MSFANIPGRKNGKDASESASRRTSNLICPPRTKTSVSNLIRDTNRTTLVYCFEMRSCRSSRTRPFALKSIAIVSILSLFEWCFTGSNTSEHRVVKFVETRLHEKLVFRSCLSSFLLLLFSGRTSKEQIGPGQWGTRIDDGINGRSPLIRNSRLRFIWRLLFTNFWQLPTTDPKQRNVALHCHIMISLLLSLSLSLCFSVLILCPRFPFLLCFAFFVSFYLVPFLSASFALIPLISFAQQDDSICSSFCITYRGSRFPLNRTASSRRPGDRRSWAMQRNVSPRCPRIEKKISGVSRCHGGVDLARNF